MSIMIQQIPSGTFYGEVSIPENWPAWLLKSAAKAENVEYAGHEYTYAVAKRDFTEQAKQLPGFVCFIGGHVLVSEDVPAQFRPFYALHEFIEMNDLVGQEGRCLQALQMELSLVPSAIYDQYAIERMLFFARLIDFHARTGNASTGDSAEMRKSLDFLIGHTQRNPR